MRVQGQIVSSLIIFPTPLKISELTLLKGNKTKVLEEELDVNISVYVRLGFSTLNATQIIPLSKSSACFSGV